MNFKFLVESILSETTIEQAVVEFFSLELAKRLITDFYYAYEGEDEEGEHEDKDVFGDEYKKWYTKITERGSDIEGYIQKQQRLSKTVGISFLDKLKQIHVIDYQLHLLELSNYGSTQDRVKNELVTSYTKLYNQLKAYCVFLLTTIAYIRHSDSGYLSNPLYIFQPDNVIQISTEESGHEEQGASNLNNKIQNIVNQTEGNDKKMYEIAKSVFTYQEIESDLRFGGFTTVEDNWSSLLNNLYKAHTILDRSAALTKVLTFAHHRGSFLGAKGDYIQPPYSDRLQYLYSPLTQQQFDSLNYINERKAEYDLKKMF